MKAIQFFISSLYVRFWTSLTNADYEVVQKNRHVLRGLQSTGLLLLGLMCTLFGLQYLALSTFTQGDHQFSLVAASLSVVILIILDRTVLDSDSRDEGQIEYLLEIQPKSPEISELKKKRAYKMVIRVGLGVTIAYIAATLSMAAFLQPEVQAEKNAMEAIANPATVEQARKLHGEQRQLIAGYDKQIAELEREVDASWGRERDARNALMRDVRTLRKDRENMQSESAFAQTCRDAEEAGRVVQGCRNTGKPGKGEIYHFWGKRMSTIGKQIEAKSLLIKEKQAEIVNSPEQITVTQVQERLTALRAEKGRKIADLPAELKRIEEEKKIANDHNSIPGGLVNDSIAVENVLAKAGDTANRNLLLFKIWIMTLELAIFAAKLCGSTKDYSLALYRESLRRHKRSSMELVDNHMPSAA